MSREILFRGKRVDNGEWVEGFFVSYEKESYIFEQSEVNKGIDTGGYLDCCQMREVIPETVGQFTGLKDKNGKKISEGDILKQKATPEFAKISSFEWEHYGVVRFGYYDWNEWAAGYASVGWYIEPLTSIAIKPKNYLVGNIQAGLNQYDINDKCYPMEVIGNLWDNPELLEVEND